ERSKTIQATTLSDNISLHLSFDDETVTDLSDYSNAITYEEDLLFSDGVYNKCLDMASSAVTVKASSDIAFANMSTATLSFWAKRNVVQAGDIVSGVLGVKFTSSNLQAAGININSSVYKNTDWHHYCYVYDGSTAKMYFDGNLLTSGAKTGTISGTSMYISGSFSGLIDELRLYRRALSEAEIRDIYLNNGYPEAPISDIHPPAIEFYDTPESTDALVASVAKAASPSADFAFHATEPGAGVVLYSTTEIPDDVLAAFGAKLQELQIAKRDSNDDKHIFENGKIDTALLNSALNFANCTGVSYVNTSTDEIGTEHTATITGLEPGKTYYYALVASDPYGNIVAQNQNPVEVATSVAEEMTLMTASDNTTDDNYIDSATALSAAGTKYSFSTPAVVVVVNNTPTLTAITAKSFSEGSSTSFTVSGSDPDGDSLTYSYTSTPAFPAGVVVEFDGTAGTFSASVASKDFITTANGSVAYSLAFKAYDGQAYSDPQAMVLTINNANQAPAFTAVAAKTVAENELLTFVISATDPDVGDTMVYAASSVPAGATFTPATRTFTWTPGYTAAADSPYTAVFTATDGSGAVGTLNVAIRVTDTNRKPNLDPIGNKSVE
ncbi:MAG: hypothetical protein GX638_19535, partial [Crenarchaeota archaeon]|nr:hypothetical protein [Thermoproteota archaeon]